VLYTKLNSRITAQRTNWKTTYFRYDNDSELISLNWQGAEYFYLRNLQGDIIGLVDENGSLVVEYAYDAWGKPLSITGELAETLGEANPFRYRSYYWEDETGLYYLQSRYYDPEVGRFVNADEPETMLFQDDILATNLFAYCFNNPVMNVDHTGMVVTPANAIGAVIGAVGGALIGLAIAKHFKLTGWKRWACTASVSLLIGVVGYFSGPAIWAAIKPVIVKAISAGTLLVNKIAIWVQQTLGVIRPFADKAINKVGQFTVSAKHLLGAGGGYAKFNTANMSTIRSWITTALRSRSNFQVNSRDSYYIVYNMGKVIGTNGEKCIKVVFTVAGKIITSYPVK
jgi:RHS repeat-associated protein